MKEEKKIQIESGVDELLVYINDVDIVWLLDYRLY